MAKLIHIFRAGRHTAANGQVINFSAADVRRTARAYRPALHEAPVVVGHPKHDDPAFGWAEGLHARGDDLFARVGELDPSFVESVQVGKRFKKVSASFYAPDSPNNPVPGTYYLRHIGFLGASPPAVKGLEQVSFSETDKGDGCVVIEFAETTVTDSAAVETADKVVSEAGATVAKAVTDVVLALVVASLGKAFPELDAAKVTEAVTTALATPPEGETSGTQLQAAVEGALTGAVEAPIKEAVATAAEGATSATSDPAATLDHSEPGSRRERQLRAREAELDAKERRARRTENEAFLAGVAREGKRLPFQRAAALEYLEQLGAGTLSFSEGQPTALEMTKQLIAALPKVVDFGEFSGGAASTDDDPTAVAARATAYQTEQHSKGLYVSTSDAVAHVSRR